MEQPRDGEDRLESTTTSRLTSLLTLGIAVAVVAAIVVGVASRSHRTHHPAAVAPHPATRSFAQDEAPAAMASPEREHVWVFLEPLARCTSVDGRDVLHTALAVTELSDRPLRLLAATATDPPSGLRLTGVRLGRPPCAETPVGAHARLPSSGEVVALSFAIGPGCPAGRHIDVRTTYDAEGSRVHADTMLNLTAVHIAGCARA